MHIFKDRTGMFSGSKEMILFDLLRLSMDLPLRFNHKIILDYICNPQIRVKVEIDAILPT